ncbi:MAG TPA: trehalose-phosphatase [Actinomycetales bacterium]
MNPSLATALERLLADRPVLLAFDFDGVLSPLVDVPSAARALPGTTALLAELAAAQGLHVALVSGRALASLSEASETPPGSPLLLVGSHGAEYAADSAAQGSSALDEHAERLLASLTAAFEQIAGSHEGVRVETKPTGVVLHTRLAEPVAAEVATQAALAAVELIGGHVTQGKQVVEVAVVETGKGIALDRLREQVGAVAVLYAGDDVTDENAFAVLRDGDVGIKVGEGPTAAAHRVADPAEMQQVLRHLAALAG